MIYEIESRKPGTMLRLLEWFDMTFNPSKIGGKIELGECSICGEPTSPWRTICKSCELQLKILGDARAAALLRIRGSSPVNKNQPTP
jgi:hypothetical protein